MVQTLLRCSTYGDIKSVLLEEEFFPKIHIHSIRGNGHCQLNPENKTHKAAKIAQSSCKNAVRLFSDDRFSDSIS